MAKKDDRFVRVKRQSTALSETYILVDKVTGVNYLWHSSGYAGGLTALLDRNGKPIVSPLPVEET